MTKPRSSKNAIIIFLMCLTVGLFVPAALSQEQNRSDSYQEVEEDRPICGLTTRGLVIISVEITDNEGVYISGFSHEELNVYENGKKQEVAFFLEEKESDIGNARVKYTVGYYPTDERLDGELRRVRIKVHKWKSKGYKVNYSPKRYLPTVGN